MSRKQKVNYVEEAGRLLKLIEGNKIKKEKDWLFIESIRKIVSVDGFVTENQIFWLRDIKDRQLSDED